MYQEAYSEMIKFFKEKNIFVPNSTSQEEQAIKYFVYNDNQTSGDTIAKLCQI